MKIGEPTFNVPSSSERIMRANEVERALLECEVGQWLPVDMEKATWAAYLVVDLKKRGYEIKRTKLVVHVKAPETARPHVHRFRYPTGVQNAHLVDAPCACGEVKKAGTADPLLDGATDEEIVDTVAREVQDARAAVRA